MSVTEAELRVQMEQLFDTIDINRNNKLEHSEVRRFSLDLHNQLNAGEPFDEDAFEDYFEHLDKNEDGTVSRMELLNSLIEKARKEGKLR